MSRFFAVSTDPIDAAQEQQMVAMAKQLYWWHWLPNFWLLKDATDTWTTGAIREQIEIIAPHARCVVLQVEPVTWEARVKPDAMGNKMEDWLTANWKRP